MTDGNFAYSSLSYIKTDIKGLLANPRIKALQHFLHDRTISSRSVVRYFNLPIIKRAKISKTIVLLGDTWKGRDSLLHPFPAAVHDSYWALYALFPDWRRRLTAMQSNTYKLLDRMLESAVVIENFDVKDGASREKFMKRLLDE